MMTTAERQALADKAAARIERDWAGRHNRPAFWRAMLRADLCIIRTVRQMEAGR